MISNAYASFFKELSLNNNRDWFQANKSRYEKDAKAPFLSLLDEVISEIFQFDPQISTEAKTALFRINRDIRFSKDKTPYNTIMKAGISSGGKNTSVPGYYLGISADKIHVGGGLFAVDKDQLRQVRSSFVTNHKAFEKVINSPSFTKYFAELKGEQAKRLEPDFKALLEKAPFIANKQFYVMREIPLKDYLDSQSIVALIVDHFKVVYPLNSYLKSVLT